MLRRRAFLLSSALTAFGLGVTPRAALSQDAGTAPGPAAARREVTIDVPALRQRHPEGPWHAMIDPSGIAAATRDLPVVTLAPDAPAAPRAGTETPGARAADAARIAPALRRLAALEASGRAAGLAGVLYDNRDRDHSPLPPALFPQLTHVRYGPELRRSTADQGLAGAIRFPATTLGNSSTAIAGGPVPRSLPRLAMTVPGLAGSMAELYRSNHLYLYPEHRDHDEVDRFPANWPYMIVSQGSSHRDQAHLQALAATLAALPPETRARAEALGLVAPVLQMIYRRARPEGATREGYLSGAAHPGAFAAEGLDPLAMVALAEALAPDAIPPAVQIAVTQEDFTDAAGLAGLSERLFDTPSAVARIWRGPQWRRSLTLSAAQTRDPNGRPLRFDWVALRAGADRLRIEPLDAAGSAARITLDWHDRFRAPGGIATDRVDIGVFADNGAHLSAPAILSVSFPVHEARRYGAGGAGGARLLQADYDADARGEVYDPLLHWSAPWRDVFAHDAGGRLAGWRREGPGGARDFAADGRARDGAEVAYALAPPEGGRRRLIAAPAP